MTLVPQLERELVEAARRNSRTSRRALRPSMVAALAVVLLALAAAALAATKLLGSGAPLVPSPGTPLNPSSGMGVVEVGSTRMLPIAAPDAAGGPPWGLRFVRTTRGLGCLQAGRLVRGQIGVIGRDGTFGNDGRFHPLAASYLGSGLAGAFPCGTLDARGHAFAAVAMFGVPASGLVTPSSTQPGCVPFRDHGPIGKRPHQPPICPRRDWRRLYFGMAGPEATSVTYLAGGRTHTVKTVGDQGAYLIVLPLRIPALGHGRLQLGSYSPLAGAGGGPIVRIDYRDGHACRLAPRHDEFSGESCPPVGQVPLPRPRITRADVASPVTATLRKSHLGPMLVISFVARVAVSDASSQYSFSVRFPGRAPNCGIGEGGPLIHNNSAGQRQHFHVWTNGCHGRFRGSVTYSYGLSGGPGLPPEGNWRHSFKVGSFSVHVP
jgi:hypothetical protein